MLSHYRTNPSIGVCVGLLQQALAQVRGSPKKGGVGSDRTLVMETHQTGSKPTPSRTFRLSWKRGKRNGLIADLPELEILPTDRVNLLS